MLIPFEDKAPFLPNRLNFICQEEVTSLDQTAEDVYLDRKSGNRSLGLVALRK